jgi:hypothetical protein
LIVATWPPSRTAPRRSRQGAVGHSRGDGETRRPGTRRARCRYRGARPDIPAALAGQFSHRRRGRARKEPDRNGAVKRSGGVASARHPAQAKYNAGDPDRLLAIASGRTGGRRRRAAPRRPGRRSVAERAASPFGCIADSDTRGAPGALRWAVPRVAPANVRSNCQTAARRRHFGSLTYAFAPDRAPSVRPTANLPRAGGTLAARRTAAPAGSALAVAPTRNSDAPRFRADRRPPCRSAFPRMDRSSCCRRLPAGARRRRGRRRRSCVTVPDTLI